MNYKNSLLRKRVLPSILGLALLTSLSFTSCDGKEFGDPMTESVIISDIKLNVTQTLPLALGADSLISFSISPQEPTNATLAWTSSDKNVAIVSSDGLITAKKLGNATITVTPELGFGASAIVKVIVIQEVTKIQTMTFQNTAPSIYMSETMELKLDITPTNYTYATLKWTSDNTAVATVTDKGVVTGIAKGAARITAASLDGSGVKATVDFTVKEAVVVKSVELNSPEGALALGEVYAMTYTLEPDEATAVTLLWSTSDEKVATVQNGWVTAVGMGTATITATAPSTGKTSGVKVTVAPGLMKYSFANAVAPWYFKVSQGVIASFDGTKMTVIMKDAAKYRADFVLSESGNNKVTLDVTNYRYMAIKMVRPGGGNVILDTNNGRYKQQSNNGNNVYSTLDVQSNGVPVYYFDLQEGFGTTPVYLSKEEPITLQTFQFVIADVPNTFGNTYEVYWVRTFKTLDDLNVFVNSENK